jgi:hypothetical protein
MCDDTTIAAGSVIGSSTGNLVCHTGVSCSSYSTLLADVKCTDFSAILDYSSGERVDCVTLPLNGEVTLGFFGSAWMTLALLGGGNWQITGRIELSLRPDGILNTSPVTSTLPVIYKDINVQQIHIVPMADANSMDILRCRWSTDNFSTINWNNWNECESVCAPTLPTGFQLFADNCTLVFTLTAVAYYGVALQIEDFYTASSPTPMSSVPIQFLFLGRNAPSGCSIPPTIIGVRPNLGKKRNSF